VNARVSVTAGIALLAALLVGADEPAKNPHQTGEPRRVVAADYQKHRIAIVSETGKVEWERKIDDCHDLHVLPSGNLLYQTSWTNIVETTPAGDQVWHYDAAKSNGNAGRKVEVHAFQRLSDGVTMIAESGPTRIIEVDQDGRLMKEVKLKVSRSDVHRDTRLVRKLSETGHYLVAHEGDNAVREYDGEGKVVWEHNVGSRVYSAQRLTNGHTLIGAGDGHRVYEIDPSGKEVWSIGENELPGIKLAWVTMVERLENGNTRVVNCHAGPENPQVFEVTSQKKVVWTFKDFEHFGNALPVARVLR
jgi:outer membrane protein assembly factor BamB